MRRNSRIYFVLFFFLLFFFGSSNNVFSQAVTIRSAVLGIDINFGNPLNYCSLITADTLTGISPTGKSIGIVGFPYPAITAMADPPGVVNERIGTAFTGRAFVNLVTIRATYGATFEFTYQSDTRRFPTNITDIVPATLDPFPGPYCTSSPSFILTGGIPAGGYYKVNGVQTTTFNPSDGAGTYYVYYYYGSGACMSSSSSQTITVNAVPAITLSAFTPVCQGSSTFVLTQGSPAGGTYSGSGVSGGVFDPAAAGIGLHPITYSYTSGSCTSSAVQNLRVNALPPVNFAGLDYIMPSVTWYCNTDPVDNLLGSPLGGGFTGAGITNIAPAGNASFNPGTAGLGEHDIKYTYTDANGCTSSKTYTTKTGTMIYINGLDNSFCKNAAIDNFNYTPFVAFPNSTVYGNGVTDNFNGNATFNPTAAGVVIGNNPVTYEFIDGSGCINEIIQNVEVKEVPAANFTGLSTDYCIDAAPVTLSGNYAPAGTFTGPVGSIVDNGNGTATLSPSSLSAGGPYSITYSYTTAGLCNDNETKQFNIKALPIEYIVTGSGSYCQGSTSSVGLTDSDVGTNYQIYKNGSIDGATKPGTGNALSWTLKTAAVYTVIAINASGCTLAMSGSATLVELPQVSITTQPVNDTVCENGTAIFSISASGQNLSYEWTKNSVLVGGNSNILAVNGVTLPQDGHSVFCSVTSSCGGPLISSNVALRVNPATTITTQPVSAIKCTGTSHTFSVVASGVSNTYYWKKDGALIAETPGKFLNVNSANLSIQNLAATEAGSYECFVNGLCGSEAQSNSASLQVIAPIAITTQPANVTPCLGANTAFSVAATPAGLTYQWFKGAILISTGSSLVINNVAAANEGTYYCLITSSCSATATSNSATLSIPPETSITTQPSDGSECAGSTFNFSVAPVGSSLQIEWYKDNTLLTNGGSVSNATTPNLTLTDITTSSSGNYTVKIIGTCGTVTSNPAAVLTVFAPIVFTSQPSSQTVCSGSDAVFSVGVTGDLLGYQWQKKSGAIFSDIGATNSSYTVVGATTADAGNYRCLITTAKCGNYYSNEATLAINPLTAITTQPVASKNACIGSATSFSVVATGVGLSYQWYKNGVTLGAGYTSSTINLTGITASSAGSYTCIVSSICGPSVQSLPGVLVVEAATVISSHPQNQSVCLNSNHELTVSLSSGTNPVYQWYFDNNLDGVFTTIGTNSQILGITGFTSANAGDYYCTVTSACGTVSSQTARLSLVNAFTITTQPSDINVCANATVSFSVAGSQPNLSYQWSKNGTPIAGTTSATLVLNNITAADNGASYSCYVSNNCNSITSNSAVLTVSSPLTISQQPQGFTGCPGNPYSLICITSGSNPQYQWYNTTTGPIAGATSSSFSIASFDAGDAGTYYCIINNGCGAVSSNNATITSGTEISITNPTALSLCTNVDANFTITASGSNPVYEWRKNDIPVTNDGRIVGSATNTLIIKNIVPGDEGTYNIVVSGTCGTAKTSTGAFLDVKTAPSITVAPEPRTICSGGNTSFSVTASGELPLIYSWQKNGITILPAVATSTINLTGATTGGIYRCVISNSCGTVTSTSAELIIEENLSLTSQPVSVTRCEGSNATFSIVVSGSTDMALQWYKDGVALVESSHINGVNLSSLSVNSITSADEGNYWCEIKSFCGNATTNLATLTVHDKITISQQPQGATVCPDNTLNLNVVISGTATNYQWKRNGVIIAGANSSAYTVPLFVAGTHAGTYTCDISNICETITSDNAMIAAGELTSASISSDITKCEGQNANFIVTSSGSNLTYKWFKGATLLTDGLKYGGSSSSSLNINSITSSDAGTYQCEVTGSCGTDNNNSAVLTVQENVVLSIEPTNVSVVEGYTAVFNVVAAGNINGYQWYKGTTALTNILGEISGATTAELKIENAQTNDVGDYKCVISGICGNKDSKTASLSVLTTSAITTQPPANLVLCENAPLNLSVSTSGSGHTYQWKRDDVNLTDISGVISGSQTSNLIIASTMVSHTGAYSCEIDNIENSSSTIVTINPITIISSDPTGANKCVGELHIFSVSASGIGLSYQWYKNSDSNPISGATSNEYIINSLTISDNGTYFCIVTGTCTAKISSAATLVVNTNSTIISQPIGGAICEGSTTSLQFGVSGSSVNYLWKKNGQDITAPNISGTNTNNLQISNAKLTDFGNYTCSVTSSCGGTKTSNSAAIVINPLTTIVTHPIGRTKCEGDAVTFTVEATGNDLIYKWKLNGVSLGAANSPTFTINNLVKTTHEGTYTCTVRGSCGDSLTSNPAALGINRNTSIETPSITVNPVCQNGSTLLSISATGDSLSYLWKRDGNLITGANVSGVHSNGLNISNALLADVGNYVCTITGVCGSEKTSSTITLVVNPTTAITSQPANFTKCAGDEVLFTVEAVGGGLLYEWRKAGTPETVATNGMLPSGAVVSGATSKQLRISGLTASEAGKYTCIVIGNCDSLRSSEAELTVRSLVDISSQPAALTSICQGNTTELTIPEDPSISSYQWKKNGNNLSNGGNISGSTTNKLSINDALLTDAGYYTVQIFGSCNNQNSQPAELIVNPNTVITQHPKSSELCEGDNIQFTVSAKGSNPLLYQWKKNNTIITDATNSTYSISNITIADIGAYTCTVTSASCGTAISNPASLNVNARVTILDQPSDIAICEDNTAVMVVIASGVNPVFKWSHNGTDLSDLGNISGSGTNNLMISPANNSNEGIYKCEIQSNCGNTATNSVLLTVNDSTAITAQPISQTVVPGTNAIFSVSASGIITSYNWQRNLVDLVNSATVTGANTSILNLINVNAADAGSYRCVIIGECGTINSDPAKLTVYDPVTLISQPAGLTKCSGEPVSFSVVASGSILSYQWMLNIDTLTNGTNVTGTQTATLVISSVDKFYEGLYNCIIYGGFNSVASSTYLTINEPVTINKQPETVIACENTNTYFKVEASGSNLVYRWQKNGVDISDTVNISGSNSSVLLINNTTLANQGAYRCVIISDCNTAITNSSLLTVNALPGPATAVSGSTELCQGSESQLYVVTEIPNTEKYVWTLPYGSKVVSGQDTRSILVNFSAVSQSGLVSVHGTNNCGSGDESSSMTVTINPKPLAEAGQSLSVCADTTSLRGNPTSFGKWTLLSGLASIKTPTSSTSYVTGLGQGENVFLWTVTEKGCVASDTVTIANNSVIANAGTDQTLCSSIATLNANTVAAATGSWSIISGGAFFSASGSSIDPKATVENLKPGANIFQWEIRNGGCSSTDDVVIINDLPTNADAGLDTIILIDTHTLIGNAPNQGTGKWTLISGSGIIISPFQNVSNVINIGVAVNTFQWTITNNFCISKDQVKVINYTPSTSYAGPDQSLCTDNTVLQGSKPNYGTGLWSVLSGEGRFVDPVKFDSEVINIGKGKNEFIWTVNEYNTSPDTVVITNNSPSAANAGIDRELCSDATTLNGNKPAIGIGKWTLIGGSGDIANPLSNTTSISNLSAGSNTYSWTITNKLCSSSDEVVIKNNKPTIADAGVDQISCEDSIILSPNNPTHGTGEWSVISGSATFTDNMAKSLAFNTNIFKWTISNKGCESSDTVKIVSFKPTTASTISSKSICENSLVLSGNKPLYGTGNWTILSGSADISQPENPNAFANNISPGLNRFRWTIKYEDISSGLQCISFSDMNVSNDFIQANAGEDNELCSINAPLSANDPSPGDGFWSVRGGSGIPFLSNSSLPNAELLRMDLGTNTLRWTITNNRCTSYDEVLIKNISPSTAFAGDDRSICGESITLNANSPAVGIGSWAVVSGSAIIQSENEFNSILTNLNFGENTLRWTIDHNGCISYDEISIFNNQPTNVYAGLPQYICSDSTMLNGSLPTSGSGRWSIASGSATFIDSKLNTSNVRNLEKGLNKLVWTVNVAGCSNSDTVYVTNNLPSLPSAGPDLDICASEANMAANLPQIGDGKWGVVSGSATFEDPLDPYTKVTKAGNGISTLRWTITNGSCSLIDEMLLINSLPTLAYAGEDRAICNNTANLLANPPTTGTGSWAVASGFGIIENKSDYNTQISELGFGANTLRWTTENGRCRSYDEVIITNNLSEVNAGEPEYVYFPNVILVGNKPSSGIGEWRVIAGHGNFANPGSFETEVTGLGEGANTFHWTINNNGCVAFDEVIIRYYKLPSIDFTPFPQEGCAPLTVDFINSSSGGKPFAWDFGDGSKSDLTNPMHTFTEPGRYFITLTGTGPDGIMIEKDTVIYVRAKPDAELSITPTLLYISDPPSEKDEPLHCFTITKDISSVIWDFGDGTFSNELNPIHRYLSTGVFDVSLHVISGYQCEDTKIILNAITVERKGHINCPNAFTPQLSGPKGSDVKPNDYSNDIFHCYAEDLLEYHLEVYNKFGVLLFQSDDINVGWDGYFSGELVQEGVYVYNVYGSYNSGETFNEIGSMIIIYN